MTLVGHHTLGLEIPKDAEAPQVAHSTQPESLPLASEGAQHILYINQPWKESVPEIKDEHVESELLTDDGVIKPKRRHMHYHLVTFLTFVALAVGIGVGIGIGRTTKHESRTNNSTPVTTTVTKTSNPETISTTSSAVTSGTTGIAAFVCNATASESTFQTSGASFREECYTEYKPGERVLNGSSTSSASTVVSDIADFTAYSFQSCIEQCTAYNQLPDNHTPCRALSLCKSWRGFARILRKLFPQKWSWGQVRFLARY